MVNKPEFGQRVIICYDRTSGYPADPVRGQGIRTCQQHPNIHIVLTKGPSATDCLGVHIVGGAYLSAQQAEGKEEAIARHHKESAGGAEAESMGRGGLQDYHEVDGWVERCGLDRRCRCRECDTAPL